jgi:hypothetical protein
MAVIPSSFNRGFAPGARAFGRRQKYAFTPYNPTVPAGSYDPGLDAALQAAQRGYADTQADYQTQGQRELIDYGLGRDQLEQQRTRGLADLGTARTQAEQDYGTSTTALQRQYQQLASSQQEQQNAAGVLGGGAPAEAAGKRAENQGIAQTSLDTARQRFLDQNDLQVGRLNEDVGTGLGQLGLGYQRSSDDALSALTRAGREASQFGVDTQAQKLFQASQAGYVAPTRPKNEFTSPGGSPYRVLKTKAGPVYVDQYGRRLSRRPA